MGLGRALGRMGRRGVLALAVMLVAAAATGAWLLTRPGAAQAAQTVTQTVTSGSYQQTVSATGTLAALHEADLDFAVSGRVTQVFVSAGDHVRKGEALAQLDATSLQTALTSAQAQLSSAEAQRTQDVDDSASSTTIAADDASVAAAESSLSQAQDDLDSATLRSTLTGTVASVGTAVGDQASGSSSSQSSQGQGQTGQSSQSQSSQSASTSSSSSSSAFVVVSPKLFTVSADVSADDVTSVKKGMQAQITPTGSTRTVYGTVTSVGLVAQTSSSGAATFPVTITITGPQTGLYAGTSATVSIITRQVTGVIAVPALALHTSGSTTYVEKLVAGQKVRTTVQLGATYGSSTVVTSGLKAGDKVVLATVRVPTGTGTRSGNEGGGFGGGFGGGGPPSGGFGGNGGGFGGTRP